ncbi:MAG: class I adenylate-forming enzyme family protein [Myxococcota bacterium]
MEIDDPRLTFGRFLRQVAARHADRVAVVSDARTLTYGELLAEARELARALLGAGVTKGARVAVWMGNGPEWIAAAFAVGMTGGVLVPINTFAKPRELGYVLRHGDVGTLLFQPKLQHHDFLDALLGLHSEIGVAAPDALFLSDLPHLRRIFHRGEQKYGAIRPWSELLAHASHVSDAVLDAAIDSVEPSDDGLIVYTSGTTADPKGVLHTQRAPILQAWRFADMLRLDADDRLYTTYPFFWTAGIAMSIGGAFAAGARLLVQETFEPGAALDMLERERASAVHAWPHQQKALGEHESAAARDLTSIRKVDFTSPLAKLAGVQEDVYGTGASYGLSETFTIASALPADAPAEERHACNGVAWPGNVLRIVDPQSGAPLPAGSEGEIALKGPTLMRGYYKVPPEHVFDADGFFRTQDGGSLDADGRLHWSGRLSNLIKTGGANVSPVEIQELLEGHPELKLAVPVGVGHPTLGQAIVLCAVPALGAAPDEAAVRGWLRERLAAYKVPKRVLFFRSDELAWTSNQKVRVEPLAEAALRRLEAEGAEIDGYTYQPSGEE